MALLRLCLFELRAALAAARRDDGATRTGAHPETEAVHARPTTVVRLERPLALGHGQHSSKIIRHRCGAMVDKANLWSFGGDDYCDRTCGQHKSHHPPPGDRSRVLRRPHRVKPRSITFIVSFRTQELHVVVSFLQYMCRGVRQSVGVYTAQIQIFTIEFSERHAVT